MSATEKPFDIVVFGASGYTGRLVAEYLSEEYGNTELRWAMAGRSLSKLTSVRSELGISDQVTLMEVDVESPESVSDMVDACRVVITTVGPYQLYG
ncbi:MAG: saccharopine dehydrogenase NADP-binding domain-containing protein, partial [Luminiphilus sp.]